MTIPPLAASTDLLIYVVVGAVVSLFGFMGLVWVVKQFMFICRPDEVLVFSGRNRKLGSGKSIGYRVIFGGRAFRVPLLEEVKRMDLSVIEVLVSTKNAFCKGGIRLNVDAIANVKVTGDPRLIGNAIERFLGQGMGEISEVACNTLEGHLRAVIATLTPEEVNEDRLKFAERLKDEAEPDLAKLGLHLDTFSINSVSDVQESSYLAQIGRKAIAEVIKNAEISEAMCERAATETEAAAVSQARVAFEQAETAIRVKKNGLREMKANWEAIAASQEAEAEAARDTARARAELELQNVRAELEKRRLNAEVVIRAEAEAQARELRARGEAAPIIERGRATASSLELMRRAWAEAGDGAKPIVMIQKLESILREVVDRVGRVTVDKVNLVDRGDGSSLPAYIASYPAAVNAVLAQLNGVTGIDVTGTLSEPVREALTHGANGTASNA